MSIWGSIVSDLGQTIVFSNGQEVKASLKQSTKAVISLAGRAYYVEGQCLIGNPVIKAGDYFIRPSDNHSTYFVVTALNKNYAVDVIYIFAAKCNTQITTARQVEKPYYNENGEKIQPFLIQHQEVMVYRDFNTRPNRTTTEGLLDQAIYTLMLPHEFMLSEGDRVIMRVNIKGEYLPQNYKVDSVSSALVDISEVGIDLVQITLDMRDEPTIEKGRG